MFCSYYNISAGLKKNTFSELRYWANDSVFFKFIDIPKPASVFLRNLWFEFYDDRDCSKLLEEIYNNILNLGISSEEFKNFLPNFLQENSCEYDTLQKELDNALLNLLDFHHSHTLIFSYFHPQFCFNLLDQNIDFELILKNQFMLFEFDLLLKNKIHLWHDGCTIFFKDLEKKDFMYCNLSQFVFTDLSDREKWMISAVYFNNLLEIKKLSYLTCNPYNYEVLYLDWLITHLSDNGRGIFILSENFFRGTDYSDFRIKLAEEGIIDAIIELPRGFLGKSDVRLILLVIDKSKRNNFIVNVVSYKDVKKNDFSLIPQKILNIKTENFVNARKINLMDTIQLTSRLDLYNIEDEFFYDDGKNIRLQKVCRIIFRGIPKSKTKKGLTAEAYYITNSDIESRGFRIGAKQFFTIKDIEKYSIHKGDIILSCKSSVKIAIVGYEPEEPILISDSLYVIRLDMEKYHPYVLFYYLKLPEIQKKIAELGRNQKVYVLNKEDLERFPIPFLVVEDCNHLGESIQKNEEEYDKAINQAKWDYNRACLGFDAIFEKHKKNKITIQKGGSHERTA